MYLLTLYGETTLVGALCLVKIYQPRGFVGVNVEFDQSTLLCINYLPIQGLLLTEGHQHLVCVGGRVQKDFPSNSVLQVITTRPDKGTLYSF